MSKKTIILTYFISVILVYLIDLITTIIALSLGAVELNPIANHLFSVGSVGVFFVLGFLVFLGACMWLIVELVYFILSKWIGKDLRFYAILLSVALLILFWGSFLAIVNNINIIIQLKGG